MHGAMCIKNTATKEPSSFVLYYICLLAASNVIAQPELLPRSTPNNFPQSSSSSAANTSLGQGSNQTTSQESLGSVERLFLKYISDFKSKLADPAIDQTTHQRLEKDLTYYENRLADHRTNAALWKMLDNAKSERDPKEIARAETALADYLAKKLGRIEGKSYPSGLSLATVIDHYNAHLGRPTPWRGKKHLVRIVFFGTLILPLVIAGIYVLRRKRAGEISIHN